MSERVVKLSELTPEQRAVVLALIEADRNAKERKGTPEMAIAEAPVQATPPGDAGSTGPATERNYRYEYVRVADLKIDPTYHVPERFNQKRADRMAARFDEDRLGVITVSLRDGVLWLIDGNHRRYAAAANGLTHIYAKVYFGLTRRREANIFIGLSDAVPLQGLDLWVARRVDEDPRVLGVESTLDRHGARVVRGGASRLATTTRAVGSMEQIYALDPGLLDTTIGMIRRAWPTQSRALDSLPVRAIASFVWCYGHTNPKADLKRLEDRLTVVTPETIYQEVNALQSSLAGRFGTGATGSGTSKAVAAWTQPRRAVLHIYNHGRRHKLADLTMSDLRAINEGRIVDLRDRD